MDVDICILAGRGDENLSRFLQSFNQLTVMPKSLIVVVDMNHRQHVPDVRVKSGVLLNVIEFRGGGRQPKMRNLALRASCADYIWFMDDDVSLERHSVENLNLVLDDIKGSSVCCVAGKINEEISYDPSTLPFPIRLHWAKGSIGYYAADRSAFDENKYVFFIGANGVKYPVVEFPQGTSMVFSVNLFGDIGFNEDLGINYASYEDSEPSFALKRAGLLTIYSPDFELQHHKLLRLDGSDRSARSLIYNYSLVRNHTLSLIVNSYPSKSLALGYSFSFTMVQFLRFVSSPSGSLKDRTISPLIFMSALIVGFWKGIRPRNGCKAK
jgi:GT2 family glycosyltransferase